MKCLTKFIIPVIVASVCIGCMTNEPIVKYKVVPSNEYIVPMTYTNSFNEVISGAFVPTTKLQEMQEWKTELDFFRSPEFQIHKAYLKK